MRKSLWLRWSWRDLRARWVQVAAIAFIIALGSGIYSGLSSTGRWRTVSYDESFASTSMYDLRVSFTTGTYVDAQQLVDAARSIPHAQQIEALEPRLIVPTQVDASTRRRTILVPGRLVGTDARGDGAGVNTISIERGRGLRATDAGERRAVVDLHFAKRYGLRVPDRVEVTGGEQVTTVGQGLAPEYFLITGEQGNLLAESNFAVLFMPIEDVQAMTGHVGQANDLVLTLEPGSMAPQIRRELRAVLGERFPDVGFDIGGRRDDDSYRLLYDDIEGDQRFYDIFAILILAGAAFAAFNLAGRIVEAQRREIGIGMALGVPPARLAIRPLLVGAQIAALGAVFGVAVGLGVAFLMGGVLEDLFPLPAWRFPFQGDVFAQGAALGLLIPMAATIVPVWRAMRVAPIDAIRTGALSPSRRVPLLARVPLPGRTTAQLPFRNILRVPRRTAMTVLGVAAAITVLVGVVGIVDSLHRTIDVAETEIGGDAPRRLNVDLEAFQPDSTEVVTSIEDSPLVSGAVPELRVGGTVERGRTKIDVLVLLLPLRGGLWEPTIDGRISSKGKPGIVLAQKAADDLGVSAGDELTLRHPVRTGLTSYRYVRTPVRVIGVSPIPTRFTAYMDRSDASVMGLEGITNVVVVNPRPGVSTAEIERALFTLPGVASVQPVREYTTTIRKEVDRALGILAIVEIAVLLLALLIAFNSASINADERARDHATMFAFGLPTRAVLRMNVVESAAVGVLGTGTGLAAGWLLLTWLVNSLIPETFPDLSITTSLATTTIVVAVVLGVVAVAIAPVFILRRLRRMDIPSTLRVME